MPQISDAQAALQQLQTDYGTLGTLQAANDQALQTLAQSQSAAATAAAALATGVQTVHNDIVALETILNALDPSQTQPPAASATG